MNARGNFYSRRHLYLDPDTQKDFWDFTFQEIGDFDLKATVEFILKEKGEDKKITLIGYSQGTTGITYALNEHEAYYRDKINLFVAIAPAIFFSHSNEEMLKSLADIKELQDMVLEMNYLEFHDNGMEQDEERDFVYLVQNKYRWVCYMSDVCTLKK